MIFFSPAKFSNIFAVVWLGTSPHLKLGRDKAVIEIIESVSG